MSRKEPVKKEGIQGNLNRLAKRTSMKLGITYKDAKPIVKAVLDSLYEEMISRRIFSLHGYFSSEQIQLKGRSYNVLGKKVVDAPDRLSIQIRPSKRMLKDVRGN